MEYAAIIAAKAASLKALPSVVKTSDSLLSVLPALPDDFHPINDIMSLIRDRRGKGKKGNANSRNSDKKKGGEGGLRSLLCTTFVEGTPSQMSRVLANMKVMKGHCDWAVIVHPSLDGVDVTTRNGAFLRGGSSAVNSSTAHSTGSIKEAMALFAADVKAAGVDLAMFQEAEPQQVILKRYASKSNKMGTDGQFAAGGDSSDALARDALQKSNPEMYKQYLKFADPTVVADRTGLEEASESASSSSNEGADGPSRENSGKVAAPDKTGIIAGKQISVWDAEIEESEVIRTDRGDIPLYNAKAYPKTLQFTYLLSILPKYRRVWLLDSDISLQGFRPEPFFRIIECAFEEPPIIAQPLITSASKDAGGKAQSYNFLNEQYWRADRENGQVDAASTSFIEIQAPLMNAAYFEWFITRMVIPLLAPSHFLGADWGFDNLFCSTAGLYRSLTKVRAPAGSGSDIAGAGTSAGFSNAAKAKSSRSRHSQGRRRRRRRKLLLAGSLAPVCVVTVGADPVHHLNVNAHDASNNINHNQHQNANSQARAHALKKMRERLNKEMMNIVRDRMPNFFVSGHGLERDPKANSYATARLDAQLSKDLKCK